MSFFKVVLVFLLACGAIAVICQIVAYLIFRVLKKLSPSRGNGTTNNIEQSPIKERVSAVKWTSASDCGTLISFRKSKSGKIFFYDLMGNRVSKIPRSKRDLAVQHDCFLGQKSSGNVVKWVPVKKSEVEAYLDEQGFKEKHSKPPLPSRKKRPQDTSLKSKAENLAQSIIESIDKDRLRMWHECHDVRNDGTPAWVDLLVFPGMWQSISSNTQVCSEGRITQGIGEFGLEPSNPIPVFGPPGAQAYLANLRSAQDAVYVEYKREGSLNVSNINYPVDRYSVTDYSGKQTELYLSCYHMSNSHQAPSGFELNARVLEKL